MTTNSLNRYFGHRLNFKCSRFQVYNFVVSSLFLFISIEVVLFLHLNSLSQTNLLNRISTQSLYGFGSNPSSLTLFYSLLLSLLFFILILALGKNLEKFVSIFSQLVFPTNILITLFFVKLIVNFYRITTPNGFSISAVLAYTSDIFEWRLLLILFVTILICLLLSILFVLQKTNLDINLLGLIIPLSVFNLVNVYSFRRDLFLFFLVLSIILFLLYGILANIFVNLQLILYFYVSCLVFSILYIKVPSELYSWRPLFTYIPINLSKVFLFLFLLCVIIFILLIWFNRKDRTTFAVLCGLWYSFGFPIESRVVAELDNFHFGEKIGLWFNTFALDLVPYSDIEFPRGLLVYFLPAHFSNLLFAGNPELYKYILLLFNFLFGISFYFVLRNFLPVNLIILSLALLPIFDTFVEIEFVNFSLLLIFLHFRVSGFKISSLLPFYLISSFISILFAPGQGLVYTLLCGIVLFFPLKGPRSRNLSRRSLIVSWGFALFLFLYFYKSVFSGLLWVYRTGSVNYVMYSDNWLPRLIYTDDFPYNLRWATLILVPILLSLFIYSITLRNEKGIILSFVAIAYVILMSGRWYARVGQNELRYVGIGLLTMLIFIILPICIALSFKFTGITLTLTLLTLLSVTVSSWNPLSPVRSNSNLAERINFVTNSPEAKRGFKYFEIKQKLFDLSRDGLKVTNLTGGSALDFYLNIPSNGGIQSPYMLVDLSQEMEYIKRLEKTSLFYGGYGKFGGLAADETTIAGRAPTLFRWLMSNNQIIKCNDLYILIKNEKLESVLKYPGLRNCVLPKSFKEEFLYWDNFSGLTTNLRNALLVWQNSADSSSLVQDKKIARVSRDSVFEHTFTIVCENGAQEGELRLISTSANETFESNFYAILRSGKISFDSRIFPITNIPNGDLLLSLSQTECEFKII